MWYRAVYAMVQYMLWCSSVEYCGTVYGIASRHGMVYGIASRHGMVYGIASRHGMVWYMV